MTLPATHILGEQGQRPAMWVQEAIYGHRLIEEQRPYMLVLEALAVCRARLSEKDPVSDQPAAVFPGLPPNGEHERITVTVPKRGEIRLMLFRGHALDSLLANAALSDDERLNRYVKEMNEDARLLLRNPNAFDYLRTKFQGRFGDLARCIELLRGLEVDALSGRRWTSRFLVPRGPHLHLPDVSDDKLSADRRFFGRGGELIYLMLNRSRHASALGERIKATFFTPGDPLDGLALAVAPAEAAPTGGGLIGYLPDASATTYEHLAEDWLRVVTLPRLPTAQKLDPLARLSALALVRHIALKSAEVGRLDVDPMPLDLLDGKRADLRSLCQSFYQRIRSNVLVAVGAYVQGSLAVDPEWAAAAALDQRRDRSARALEVLRRTFHAQNFHLDTQEVREPEAWMEAFIEEAVGRSRNDISSVVKPLSEAAGLATSRQRVGTWWRATDELLEALVLANVEDPMTIEEFVARLHKRYGLVIGPTEASSEFPVRTFDIVSFEENLRALEKRMMGLGYVRRLSDDCAFVSNPFRMDVAA